MPSPFPGMDPYLERHWRDVHQALVTYARDALNTQLPRDLMARTEERVAIEAPEDVVRVILPDVRVVEDRSSRDGGGVVVAAATAIADPVVLEVLPEEATEGYVTIIDPSGQLVTVIEFLSPTNKRGAGLDDYIVKKAALLSGGVNLVEIDLVRQGDYRPLVGRVLPEKLQTTYRAMIRRPARPRRLEFFPIPLRQRLPTIPIPLRPTDPDTTLDLQALIEQAYRNGRYDRTNYAQPPEPPLEGVDAEWARQLIEARPT